ncbi:MAG: DUF1700 domain-containing protein [Lachnospiraceae bacterium]|nr:DUF1700 domain-containing protein [Lachnospiraceae bacterium]
MKKQEFIDIIRTNLRVLEDREIDDIVAEYEQHIDMKMATGLSEEAAIEDFGDLTELTAGILEAYHVKGSVVSSDSINESKETEKGESAGILSDETAQKASAIMKKAGNFAKGFVKGILKLPEKYIRELKKDEATNNKRGFIGSVVHFFKKTVSILFRFTFKFIRKTFTFGVKCFIWLINFCKKYCKLAGKVVLAFVGVFVGMLALISIGGMGFSAVLLILGYPMIGVTVISAGTTLICLGCVITIFAVLFGRKTDNKRAGMSDQGSDLSVGDEKMEKDDIYFPEVKHNYIKVKEGIAHA